MKLRHAAAHALVAGEKGCRHTNSRKTVYRREQLWTVFYENKSPTR